MHSGKSFKKQLKSAIACDRLLMFDIGGVDRCEDIFDDYFYIGMYCIDCGRACAAG